MLNRRHVLGALATTAVLSHNSIALAMDKKAFDQKAFEAAQAAGKPILVEVSAPWCPVCKAQAPILSRLRAMQRFTESCELQYRFRYAEGPAEEVRRAEAKHADRLQGQAGNWALDRRHQRKLDRSLAREVDLT